jgi:hypothetical protein
MSKAMPPLSSMSRESTTTERAMQIHLATPGGEKQGPYTLEQINRDLAAKKYRDTDYWAWYDGADAWVPLYAVPGISPASEGGASLPTVAEPEPSPIPAELQSLSPSVSAGAADSVPGQKMAETEQSAATDRSQVSAGIPSSALQQIFIFTSGEGPPLMRSPISTSMLQEIIGEDWSTIREKVPRDVFGRCNIGERVRSEGKVPPSAWRAMSAIKPALIQRAREGEYRTCVRTFSIETGEVVAVFLFYGKQGVESVSGQ